MKTRFMIINSYEELKTHLRNWRQFNYSDPDTYVEYDFGGMVHLLGACLENLKTNAPESELERMDDYLSDDLIEFAANVFQKK